MITMKISFTGTSTLQEVEGMSIYIVLLSADFFNRNSLKEISFTKCRLSIKTSSKLLQIPDYLKELILLTEHWLSF